jgi:hypothetical protein
MRNRCLPAMLALLLFSGACASSDSTVGERARHQSNLITSEDLLRINANDTYEAVRQLRPVWLQKRGTSSISEFVADGDIYVYIDRVRLGGPESLRQINPLSVTRIEYLGPALANNRFGMGHHHGVILVHQD